MRVSSTPSPTINIIPEVLPKVSGLAGWSGSCKVTVKFLLEVNPLRELVFATVLAEIKNAFVDEINDPDLIQLLYGGVAYPLGISIGKVQKGAASKIVNREPGGRPLRVIKGHSQDAEVKESIGGYFKQNVIRHFMPDMEEEIIFHLRSVIKEDKDNISDSKRDELLRLGRKETFAEFLGQVYLYSLTRDNVLTPEAKERINTELEAYKRHPLEDAEVPDHIIHEEHAYTDALVQAYAQVEKKERLSLDEVSSHPPYAEHLADQRRYYFAAEAVRRGTRDIYKVDDQFNVLKDETYEGIKEIFRKRAVNGLDRLNNVLIRAVEIRPDRCWLCRDTDWIGMAQKKGICHFLINDGKIPGWVRSDDGQAV